MYLNDCFPGQCMCDLGPPDLSTMDDKDSLKIGCALPAKLHGGSDCLDPQREILYWYTVNKADIAEFLGLFLDCPKDLHPDLIKQKPYGNYYSLEERDQRSYTLTTCARRSYWHRRFNSGDSASKEQQQYELWGSNFDKSRGLVTIPRDVMDSVLNGTASTNLLWRLEGALMRLFVCEDMFPEKHMYLLLWMVVCRAKCGVHVPSTMMGDAMAAVTCRRALWTCGDAVPLKSTYARFRYLHLDESIAWDRVTMAVLELRESWVKSADSLSCGVHEGGHRSCPSYCSIPTFINVSFPSPKTVRPKMILPKPPVVPSTKGASKIVKRKRAPKF
jgi:hypothetical protein